MAGLTGGIATGKSTVSKILKTAGATIIDADKIAREVVAKGRPAWRKIVKCFGRDVLLPNGEVNRISLGNIIFHNHEQKRRLNRIVHPYVYWEIEGRLAHIKRYQPPSVIILDVPLLIETGKHRDIADVIVVYIPESLQIKRLMARDHLSRTVALERIRSQLPMAKKIKQAGIVIDNSSTIDRTKVRTLEVYRYLRHKIGRSSNLRESNTILARRD